MQRKADGFEDETLIILPKQKIRLMENDALCAALYLTDLGLFPHAANHYRSRPNGAEQHILILCLAGTGFFELSGQPRREVRKTQAFWVPAKTPHIYGSSAHDPWTILWFHFLGSASGALCSKPAGTLIDLDFETDQIVRTVFSDICHRLRGEPEPGVLRYVCSGLAYILARVFSVPGPGPGILSGPRGYSSATVLSGPGGFSGDHSGSGPQLSRTRRDPSAIAEAVRVMGEHIQKPLTLEQIAAKVNYSVSQFSSYFRHQLGVAPMEYYRRIRIQRACALLDRSAESIGTIARLCGFDDPLYFSRMFKQNLGVTPSEYRAHPKG